MSGPNERLVCMIQSGEAALPLPARGQTRLRWQALSVAAAEDVALAKLLEGHTDALAIMSELGAAQPPPASVWGTWAAEPSFARLKLRRGAAGAELSGRKAWCSGSDVASHALVTAWDEQNRQCLAAVPLNQPGVQVTTEGWHAVGMSGAASGDVLFSSASAVEIGKPDEYLNRPGFWQGGCGIAACWFGGALPLAKAVAELVARRGDPHSSAHLGAIHVAIRSTRALLLEAAKWIDDNPAASAQRWALLTRASAEHTVGVVIERAGRALGAGPLCRDAAMARRFADLPVFVRQSHAEHDLAALGGLVAGDDTQSADTRWRL